MEEQILDCRGLACPQPVVETKKRLQEVTSGLLTVLVDSETAKNNVLKLAGSLRLEVAVRPQKSGFAISLRTDSAKAQTNVHGRGRTLLVTADVLGRGSEELGVLLMKSFFYALAENDVLPESVTLLNSGVRLACEGSPVLDSLAKLEARGVVLQSCGLCLEYFQLQDKRQAGTVTNMYAIVDQLLAAETVIL
ncbi:MAG: sulfurtransferase-like selenium metabolism protein YedF [Dethiobacter sp.]|nr:sulfurtransferase-like selenium metabolism protein YedF [Dethiobacter sp.]MCL5982984.1 sulfurtransferase-like selenium metabolism protein YedF [Bacillota bacterium]